MKDKKPITSYQELLNYIDEQDTKKQIDAAKIELLKAKADTERIKQQTQLQKQQTQQDKQTQAPPLWIICALIPVCAVIIQFIILILQFNT